MHEIPRNLMFAKNITKVVSIGHMIKLERMPRNEMLN